MFYVHFLASGISLSWALQPPHFSTVSPPGMLLFSRCSEHCPDQGLLVPGGPGSPGPIPATAQTASTHCAGSAREGRRLRCPWAQWSTLGRGLFLLAPRTVGLALVIPWPFWVFPTLLLICTFLEKEQNWRLFGGSRWLHLIKYLRQTGKTAYLPQLGSFMEYRLLHLWIWRVSKIKRVGSLVPFFFP